MHPARRTVSPVLAEADTMVRLLVLIMLVALVKSTFTTRAGGVVAQNVTIAAGSSESGTAHDPTHTEFENAPVARHGHSPARANSSST